MTLSDAELERYAPQLALAGIGLEGQERLGAASAIVVGAGGLGTPAAACLGAAGLGRIGVADSEPVAAPDLRGGSLHFTPDIGRNKAESAAAKLSALNPEIQSEPYPVRMDEANVQAIVAGSDVVLDCSSSADTRLLVNDACCAEGVALVVGSATALHGLVMSIRPGASACYRCSLPVVEGDAASEPGRVGALDGTVGSIQALEAIKLVTGAGMPLLDRVLELDGRDMTQTLVAVSRRAGCPGCAGAGASQQSG